MSLWESVLLGLLQGLTEFLPVSSSGHLVIAQSLIKNFSQPGVLFDAFLHLGTTFAVVYFFRKRVFSCDPHFWGIIALGTIPAGILGFLFSDQLEFLFSSPRAVALALLVTGGMNWMVDSKKLKVKPFGFAQGESEKLKVNAADSLFVGILQAVALVPGISRSGATIFAGVLRGLDKREAAAFSFLLSIPAIIGSFVLQIGKYRFDGGVDWVSYLVGAMVAGVVGYLTIGVVMKFLISKRFKVFAVYCFLVGLAVLIVTL